MKANVPHKHSVASTKGPNVRMCQTDGQTGGFETVTGVVVMSTVACLDTIP